MDDKLKQFYKDNYSKEGFVLSEEDKAKVKDRIFANLGAQTVEEAPVSVWKKIQGLFLKTYVIVPLLVLLFISGTTIVSAHALPGDPLYPVKRQIETAQLLFTPSEEAKLDLQVKFAQKRLEEAEEIKALNGVDDSDDSDSGDGNNDANRSHDTSNELEGTESNLSQHDSKSEDRLRAMRNKRRDAARNESENAVEFLNSVQKRLENSGQNQKARDIQNKVEKFRKDFEKRLEDNNKNSESEDSGKVKGDATYDSQGKSETRLRETLNTQRILH